MTKRDYNQERAHEDSGRKSWISNADLDARLSKVEAGLTVVDTRVKVGFGILAVLVTSPKVGGPTPSEVATALINYVY